jgi:Kef-type K+ transport system membrane component KefB
VPLVLAFSGSLLVAVLISARAHRTVLSTAVLFLVAGVALSAADLVALRPEDDLVTRLAEIALFGVLFSDGMRVGLRDLVSAWRLPGRALLVGMPITVLITAALARSLAGLPWGEAFLLGAVLAPTDPVFAAAIVGRQEVPGRLRHVLNVESGFNDGLALPVVVVLLGVLGGDEVAATTIATELAAGVALGVGVPLIAIRLEQSRFFSAAGVFQPLNGVAIGLLVYGLASVTHANLFLAAFTAGVTVATVGPEVRRSFHSLGEQLTEVLKLLALLVFGVLMSPSFLAETPLSELPSPWPPSWSPGLRRSRWRSPAAICPPARRSRRRGSVRRGSPRWSTPSTSSTRGSPTPSACSTSPPSSSPSPSSLTPRPTSSSPAGWKATELRAPSRRRAGSVTCPQSTGRPRATPPRRRARPPRACQPTTAVRVTGQPARPVPRTREVASPDLTGLAAHRRNMLDVAGASARHRRERSWSPAFPQLPSIAPTTRSTLLTHPSISATVGASS